MTVCNKKVDPNAGLQRQSENSKNSFIAGIHKKYKTGMPHMNQEHGRNIMEETRQNQGGGDTPGEHR